jgi:hypothetical protein
MEVETREILRGTQKGSYDDFKHVRANNGIKFELNIFMLIFNKLTSNKNMVKKIQCLKNGHKTKEVGKNLTRSTLIKKCVVCGKIINEKLKTS